MADIPSFGAWLRKRRKALDLTLDGLAQQVNCSVVSIRKFEGDERRPSRYMAERLAAQLKLPVEQHAAFVRYARGGLDALPPELPTPVVASIPTMLVAAAPTVSVQGYLPTRLSSFIGRATEQDALVTFMQRPDIRLLTLTGPGGAGKTSLAVQVATCLAAEYPDGAWFVDLSPISDPQLVANTIAQTLGIPERPHTPMLAVVQEWLRLKQLLLVVDNFEQVVDAATVVSSILSAARRVKVLVTSRASLQLQGEHEYPLATLGFPSVSGVGDQVLGVADQGEVWGIPRSQASPGSRTQVRPPYSPTIADIADYEAITLFVDRAQAVVPSFRLTEANAAAVAEICTRLDGLPLAIELAAARVRHFTIPHLLSCLREIGSLSLLTGGTRDQPARQQTIRATIEWSYRLLHPSDQQLFRWLGVFVGGWNLLIAQPMVGAIAVALGQSQESSAELFDHLSILIDSNLVMMRRQTDTYSHYFMLETLREYALEQLQSCSELDIVRRAKAHIYRDFAAGLYTDEPTQTARRQIVAHWAAVELDNLRTVTRWAINHNDADIVEAVFKLLGDCLRFLGQGNEVEQWTYKLVIPGGVAEQRPAFRAFLVGLLCWSVTTPEAANTGYTYGIECRAIYLVLGDRTGVAWACRALAQVEALRNDWNAAQAFLEESLVICQETSEEAGLAFSWLDLGMLYLVYEQGEKADSALQESLIWFQKTEDVHGLIQVPAHLVQSAILIGNMPLAKDRLRDCLLIEEVQESEGYGLLPVCAAAIYAVASGQATSAVHLFGFIQFMVEFGSGYVPMVHVIMQREMAQARTLLGDTVFNSAFTAGQALTLERAIQEALRLTIP